MATVTKKNPCAGQVDPELEVCLLLPRVKALSKLNRAQFSAKPRTEQDEVKQAEMWESW